MADIESPLYFELAANNISPSPEGLPPSSSPNIVYSEGRESLAMAKRWWNRVNPTVISGGSATAGTLTYGVTPTEGYKQGQTYCFIVGVANSGAYTINVNGLGAKSVLFGGAPLTGGELVVGAIVVLSYDNAGVFQIIGASAGKASVAGYLPLAGGTLTGSLALTAANNQLNLIGAAGAARVIRGFTAGAPASARWEMNLGNTTAEGGSNSGSDFAVIRYNDAGSLIDTPLTINRASGNATFGSAIIVDRVSGAPKQMLGYTSGLARWGVQLANGVAETGGNAGSDFQINRYTDAGGLIDSPLSINRASGAVTIAPTLNLGPAPSGNSAVNFSKNAGAFGNFINGNTAGSQRWQMVLGDTTAEGGSNAGSNFSLSAYSDAAAPLGAAFSIVRSTRVVTFAVAIVNGPSDRSLKENIAPLEGSLDKVMALKGVSFNFIRDADKRRQIGLVAQDVAPIVPEVMQDFIQPDEPPALAIDYTRLVPLLVEAIKELTAKVARLEAGLATASQA